MKILFISAEYPPETDKGGIGTFTYNLSRGFSRLDKKNYIEIFSRSYNSNKIIYEENGRIKVIRKKCTTFASWLWNVYKFLQKNHNNYDIIFDEFFGGSMFLPSLLMPDMKYITVLHGSHREVKWIEEKFDLWNQIKINIMDYLEKKSTLNAYKIVAPSHLEKELVAFGWNISTDKINVIPNPILISENISKKNILKLEYNINNYIAFYGRMQKKKGVYTILRSLPLILKDNPDIYFIFIGRDVCNFKSTVNHFLKEEHIKRVLFLEFIEKREDLMKILKDAKLIHIPSEFESFSMTALESMSLGVPVILSKSMGIMDVINKNSIDATVIDTGDYIELARCTNLLLNDIPKSKQMAQNAQRAVREDCEAAKVAKKYMVIINGK